MRTENINLMKGNCLELLKTLSNNSVDSIVTDPPYGLSFMGKKWDYDVPSVEIWRECLRVLKHGGHLLSFGGTRTYHRMVVAIEDAGFEIRDQIMWVYGSGFPKSQNVGKNIEKINVGGKKNLKQIGVKKGIKVETGTSGYSYSKEYVAGVSMGGRQISGDIPIFEINNEWGGWGTALKPAHEPICLARKPLIGTVAENVLAHGTGGLNIDGCRVGDTGRWPANFIHDGSEEVVELFPQTTSGAIKAGSPAGRDMRAGDVDRNRNGGRPEQPKDIAASKGSVARFFYCAKASKKDRGIGNNHPTVKPTDLMRYLCRLITPPNGVVLDPFMGSGSTGKAARQEGFKFIGCELDESYFEIAQARIGAALWDSML